MAVEQDCLSTEVGQFKQNIRTRLAFLGMPQGDVTKFVELCMKLATIEAPCRETKEVKKLARALSRDLGKPRADLFVKWLLERVVEVSKCEDVAVQSTKVQPGANCPGPQSSLQSGASRLDETQAPAKGCNPTSASTSLPQSVVVNHVPEASKSVRSPTEAQSRPDDNGSGLSETWVKVTSTEGKSYYWNRSSNSCSWQLPVGITNRWTSHKSSEKRTYYCDAIGSTVWTLPPLQTAPPAPTLAATSSSSTVTQTAPAQLQSSLFIPDIGTVFPVVLPSVPISSAAMSDDLGPFEIVLQPETPVLVGMQAEACHASTMPESTVQECPSPLSKRKSADPLETAGDEGKAAKVEASETASKAPAPIINFDTKDLISDEEKKAILAAALAGLKADIKPSCSDSIAELKDPKESSVLKPSRPRNCLKPSQPRNCLRMQSPRKAKGDRVRSRSPRRSVCDKENQSLDTAASKSTVAEKSFSGVSVFEHRRRAMMGGA